MNKRKISLITMAATLALTSAALAATATAAYAEREVTVSSTNIFYVSGNAEIGGKQGTDGNYYPLLTVESAGATVSYRKDLAYSWVENVSGSPEQGLFNMEMGLTGNYEKFFVKFQSQQYALTEEGVTDNYLVFESTADGANVYVTANADELDESEYASLTSAELEKFTVEFTGRTDDGSGYNVSVAGNQFVFENVGGTYADYVSSSKTNPATPITFYAEFASGTADKNAGAVMYNLNGQNLKYVQNSSSTEGYDKKIVDDKSPVLCFDEQVRFLEYGDELDVTPVAIDVIASSPTIETWFAIAKVDSVSGEVVIPEYTQIKTNDEYRLLDSAESYYVKPADLVGTSFDDEFTAKILASVYYVAKDVSTDSGESSGNVYLDWYVDGEYKINKGEQDYLFVGKDGLGVSYAATTENADGKTVFGIYQDELDALTIDENGQPKYNAGSSNYLYLPSVQSLFSENLNDYSDLKFSIYYEIDGSQKSRTSLSYNKLSINLEADGIYTFTIYATDSYGNNMYYLNGEGELVEIKASDIWDYLNPDDEEKKDIVPWFDFKVGYVPAEVEAPGQQSVGYVGTKYTADSFDINGVSGKYTAEYSLYLFDRLEYTAYLESIGETEGISYNDFVDNVAELFENPETRKFFTVISPEADLEEYDDDYEFAADHEWNSTSLSFIPQNEARNSFYVIRLTLTDTELANTDPSYHYMAISVSKKATALKGESQWLQNNVASVVLLSIGALSLIGLIVILLIKPKEDVDIDEVKELKETNKKE